MQLVAVGGLNGLQSWLTGPVMVVIVIFAGLAIMLKSHGGNHSGALRGVAVILVGLFVIGLAHGTNASQVGNWLDSLLIS